MRHNTSTETQTDRPCCAEIESLFDPALFKALSDPNRVAILAGLSLAPNEQSVSEIAGAFELNFSVVSRHLKVLKDAGVLHARKDGKEVRYRVNTISMIQMLRKMADVLEDCQCSCQMGYAQTGKK